MNKKIFLLLFSGVLVGFLLPTANVFAVCQQPVCAPGQVCIPNPLCVSTFEDLINSVINFIFYIAIAIAPLMIIIAAVFFLISAGDPKKIDTAKNIILYTSIGLAVILLAKGLIAIIKQILGG